MQNKNILTVVMVMIGHI